MPYVPSGTPQQSGPQVVMMGGHAHTYQAIPHAGGEERVYTPLNLDCS